MKRKLNPVIQKELPDMRSEAIKFVKGTIKQKWKEHMAMDVVDCLLLNWFFPYKEKAIKQVKKEIIEEIEKHRYKNGILDGDLAYETALQTCIGIIRDKL